MTKLKTLRKQRGISQVKLAESSGVTQQMISMIENGDRDPGAAILYRLARALDVTMDELYGGDMPRTGGEQE